jgi:voltage-gated potassium channel
MGTTQRLILALTGLVGISALGTVGYVLLEGVPWLDALYMTVITISTVGYSEVVELDRSGKLFTIALIVVGVGLALYLLSVLAELLIEGRVRDILERRAMQHQIDRLERHTIVCGFGRFGSVVVDELVQNQVSLAIIESNVNKEAELARRKVPFLIGSALSDEALERAGIRRASNIVVCTNSDSDNVFITLSARELNPQIRIHARGESDAARRRLRLAGAEQVVSAHRLGGLRVVNSLLRPSVVDFLEISRPRRGEEVDLEEIHVTRNSPLVGQSIGALEKRTSRLRIVALKRATEPIRIVPETEMTIEGEDHLVVIGERVNLGKLAQQAQEGA